MKRPLYLLILLSFLFISIATAGEYEIKPKYYDLDPNDGFSDPGSRSNPYIIQDERGREVGSIAPKYHDLDPNDGISDPGSRSNPYTINTND
jgi:hypothetical protein